MNVTKGLATWAGLIASIGQYCAAVAVFLEADNQTDALGPLVTATATLLAVIVGRMQQAKAAIEGSKTTAPGPPMYAVASSPASSGANVTWSTTPSSTNAPGVLGQPADISKEVPGGSVIPDGERP